MGTDNEAELIRLWDVHRDFPGESARCVCAATAWMDMVGSGMLPIPTSSSRQCGAPRRIFLGGFWIPSLWRQIKESRQRALAVLQDVNRKGRKGPIVGACESPCAGDPRCCCLKYVRGWTGSIPYHAECLLSLERGEQIKGLNHLKYAVCLICQVASIPPHHWIWYTCTL